MSKLYEKPKKILCAENPKFVTAHQLSDNMIEIVRQDQKIIITGSDFSVMATDPTKANSDKHQYTSIVATNGVIDSSDLEYKAEQPDDQPPEGKQFKLDANGEKEKDADGKFIFEDKPAEE